MKVVAITVTDDEPEVIGEALQVVLGASKAKNALVVAWDDEKPPGLVQRLGLRLLFRGAKP